MSQVKATPIYGNWKMLGPEGNLMCRCDNKRALWYLKRGLADDLGDNTIKLKFEPGGPGNADAAFLLEEKQNVCVVCGSADGLNRHHIVPYQYRKHFPLQQKAHTSYDVVPICLDHHHEYEEVAQLFAVQLGIEYNAPFNPMVKLTPDQTKLRKILMSTNLLLNHAMSIPDDRLRQLEEQVSDYLDVEPTIANLREFQDKNPFPRPQNGLSHGQLVIEQVLAKDGLNSLLHEFIKRWRLHFVETMKPQFLSKSWDIEYART